MDTVSGATIVSQAIIDAAAKALAKGGSHSGRNSKRSRRAAEANAVVTAHLMKPGVYYGEAYGKWPKDSNEGGRFLSPKVIKPIKVEVTVDEKRIVSVAVLSCDDTPGFKESAINQVPKTIVDYQSIGVDAVSGSTLTSMGIIAATTQALEQAGADLLAFNAKQPKVNASVEYTTDVVVVGAGASGSAAALAAVEKGSKVIIIEKTGQVGGMGGSSTGFIGVRKRAGKKGGGAPRPSRMSSRR